jgi:hypothetical protein
MKTLERSFSAGSFRSRSEIFSAILILKRAQQKELDKGERLW